MKRRSEIKEIFCFLFDRTNVLHNALQKTTVLDSRITPPQPIHTRHVSRFPGPAILPSRGR